MGGEGEVSDARSIGQDHRDGRPVATLAAPRLQDVADGARAEGIPLEREPDRGREFLRAIVIEQRVQSDQVWPEDVAPFGEAREERGGDWDRESQAIAGTGRIGLVMRRREQALEMRRVVDRDPRVVAAWMPRDLLGADDEPHGGRVREQRQRLADVGMRNRVAVAIEADVRQFAGDDGPQDVGFEGMRGQREQARLLLGQDLGDRPVAVLGMGPLMGAVVAPLRELRIEIVDIAKGAGRKEGVAEIANLAFDFTLLIPARRRAGPRGEMIMAREFEQPRMEANRRALPLEHGTLQVVVHEGPRRSAEDLKRVDMAA